ncbi:MAG: polysaccharide deacetylase family protein [Bacteroidota bacterium]|nr:polysaccharide deacetylase family protein [Bacteroidota bacterium]
MFTPVRPPYLLRRYYNRFTWNIPGEGRKVYLTFDDGPVTGVTDFVLDTLDDFKVKATFFCIGANVKKNPELFQRTLQSGHRVGNHTFQHTNGWLTNVDVYVKDVAEAAHCITSNLFRPPYGRIKKSQAELLLQQYRIIMWDVLSYDFDSGIKPAQCLQNVTMHTRPGSVIVFHDSQKAFSNVKAILPRYLEFLLKNDFVPEVIP